MNNALNILTTGRLGMLSRKKGGTGLGLAICRKMIEQHEGKIWAESNFGEGSIFSFTLPILKT
jgi:two-component system, OmpR family, sensor histidine kinase VicK